MEQSSEPLRSPVHERHEALGAAFSLFGGWEMPREYAGVLAEHAAVRSAVGLFDVSHLGKVRVAGPGALDLVNRTFTNDVGRVGDGGAQYTLCCQEDGGIVDDLIVYRYSDTELWLVPNAANSAAVLARLQDGAAEDDELTVTDAHRDLGVLALQGPASDDVLAALGLPHGHPYMAFEVAEHDGATVTVCRTGYTGERGYELVVGAEAAPALWDALLDAGSGAGIVPCGLGARDTLRTEMGYPLHGQDITPAVTPVQARMGWAVGWGKADFTGKEALVAEREAGPARLLRGLRATGRGIPRPGMRVLLTADVPVGEVTSGTFSPTLRQGIGLALLARQVEEGAEVVVDVRGRREVFEVVRPPFVNPSVR